MTAANPMTSPASGCVLAQRARNFAWCQKSARLHCPLKRTGLRQPNAEVVDALFTHEVWADAVMKQHMLPDRQHVECRVLLRCHCIQGNAPQGIRIVNVWPPGIPGTKCIDIQTSNIHGDTPSQNTLSRGLPIQSHWFGSLRNDDVRAQPEQRHAPLSSRNPA